ncbi:putative glycine-rich cell wall structural protein 1 [Herrania umbratica]|uniref:Glycine-rich cell wall structural protein 1 n=1 Tax=Herrania umbratica TaxID=108875 RepID=A0A6J1AI62_9ROSI|nr:putative glycine-rich cell wall structural protein 1 [Herrania umbratica]
MHQNLTQTRFHTQSQLCLQKAYNSKYIMEKKMQLNFLHFTVFLIFSLSAFNIASARGDTEKLTPSEMSTESNAPSGDTNGASGSGHGPNWDYGWGWGSSPAGGWGYGSGSGRSPNGFGRGYGFGFGSGTGSGSGYGYGSGGDGAHGGGYGAGSGQGSSGGSGYGGGSGGSSGNSNTWPSSNRKHHG